MTIKIRISKYRRDLCVFLTNVASSCLKILHLDGKVLAGGQNIGILQVKIFLTKHSWPLVGEANKFNGEGKIGFGFTFIPLFF